MFIINSFNKKTQPHPSAIPPPHSLQTNHINPSFLPSHTLLPFHPLLIPSPPPTPSNPPRLPQTPHCTSTHTQNPKQMGARTTHTPSPPSHFLPILNVGPHNPSYHTLEVHFRTMEMFKTAVYSVECLKEKPIASPVVGTVIQRVTHRMWSRARPPTTSMVAAPLSSSTASPLAYYLKVITNA